MKFACALATLLVVVASPAQAQQSAPLKACPLLDLADAAVITGPGVEFYSGRESTSPGGGEKMYLCFFGTGNDRSLTVKTGPSLVKDAAAYRQMMEPILRLESGKPEPGIGEYAHSKLTDDEAEVTTVKGTTVLTLELKGKKLKAADLEKLRVAAKKALTKF